MRKLILGIVAVLCVQIMFQIFMAVELSDEQHRATIAAGPLVGPISSAEETKADVTNMPDGLGLARVYPGETIVAAHSATRERVSRLPVSVRVAQTKLSPVVITVAAAPKLPPSGFYAPQTSP